MVKEFEGYTREVHGAHFHYSQSYILTLKQKIKIVISIERENYLSISQQRHC